jgi:Lipoprotein LpqB beta-propeller domain
MWAALIAAFVAGSVPAHATQPSRIVFANALTGVSDIYSIEPSGQGLAQLTFGTDEWIAPVPSPDGRRLAAFRRVSEGANELWIMRADGLRARAVMLDAWGAGWSSDSRLLAFSAIGGFFVSAVGGSTERVLDGITALLPTLSPDGTSIAFLRPTGPGSKLVVLRHGTEIVAAKHVNNLLAPSWSPDGSWIAIRSDTGALELVRPAGGRPKVLAPPTTGSPQALGEQIPWSHDGRWLAYADASGVRVVSARGGPLELLVKGTFTDVAWAPRSDVLAFTGPHGVGVVTLTGRSRILFPTTPLDFEPGLAWTLAADLPYRSPVQPEPLVTVTPQELRSHVPIRALSADGDRVAYSLCWRRLGAWRPGDVEPVPLGMPQGTACRIGTTYFGDWDLALAADRLAYLSGDGGTGNWALLLTSLSRRDPGVVVSRGGIYAPQPWPAVGDLLGDGSLLVYGTWVDHRPDAIWRLDAAQKTVRIAEDLEALSLDRGRIVARRVDGTIELLDASGSVLRTFDVAAAGAVLADDDLVLISRGRLRDFSASTGELLHTWPLPDVPSSGVCRNYECPTVRLTLDDAARRLVLYTLDGVIHLLRLRDGADRTLPGATAAELENAGLFYSYTGEAPWPSRIRFVPLAELPL